MISTFQVGTAGLVVDLHLLDFQEVCGGLSDVLPNFFVLYLNYLPPEAFSSTSSISTL